MLKRSIGFCIIAISVNTALAAMELPLACPPDHGFFIGIGGNYNAVDLQNQTVWGKGVNNAFLGPVLTSTGSAAGTSNQFNQNENTISPYAQMGYFQHFSCTPYFWGVKGSYNYINSHFADYNMTIPQAGSNFNVITHVTTDFTGNYAVESVQTKINHEFLMLAFIGQSFSAFNFYAGAGASVVQQESKIYHLIGFADYKGNPGTDISGAPVNLSNRQWEWGWAAQLGFSYSPYPSLLVDLNYTYAMMVQNTVRYVSPFTNQILFDHLIGTSYIRPSQQAVMQSLTLSINKTFG